MLLKLYSYATFASDKSLLQICFFCNFLLKIILKNKTHAGTTTESACITLILSTSFKTSDGNVCEMATPSSVFMC